MEREEQRLLREVAGLDPRELRRYERAEAHNWRGQKREAVRAARGASRVLELGTGGGGFTVRLLREILGQAQTLTTVDIKTDAAGGLAAAYEGRLTVIAADLCRLPDLGKSDLIVSHLTLHDLELGEGMTLASVLADWATRLNPGGRMLLFDKVLDGVPAEASAVISAGLTAELGRRRGRRVFGLHRLDDYRQAIEAGGLEIDRCVLLGQDPGPRANEVRASFLQWQGDRLADSVPLEQRLEVAGLIRETAGLIGRSPVVPLPMAAIHVRPKP